MKNLKVGKKMWFSEACEKEIKNNSKSFQFESKAHIKDNFHFRRNNDLTDKKFVSDDPNINQLNNIVEENIRDCMQYFQRFQNECDNRKKIFGGENGEEVTYFAITWRYKILYEPVDVQIELDFKIKKHQHGENDFSF